MSESVHTCKTPHCPNENKELNSKTAHLEDRLHADGLVVCDDCGQVAQLTYRE